VQQGFTAAEASLVETARAFATRVIAPQAAGWEAAGAGLPRAVVREWVSLGLNALQVSPGRGGAAGGFHAKIAIAEALAEHCMASAFALINIQGSLTRIEREGSPSQIARYLPGLLAGDLISAPALSEPGAGSDFAAIATSAEKVPGGWRLEGEKAWVTNGALADLLVLYAQTEPGAGWRGIASFLVDLHAPGVERLPPDALTGGGAIGAAGIRLTQVFVPDDDLFAPAGQAFKRALRGINGARTHVAAMVCATVGSALRIAVDYAAGRASFGQPLLAHQGLRWQLADVATELEAARLLTARAVDLIADGAEAQLEAAFAKKYAAEMATRGIAACMQAMGAEGLRPAHGLARRLASGPRLAFGYMKRNLLAAETAPLASVLDLEAMHQARTSLTEDHREARQAFVEKRPPVFTGR
jgi:alkylation response protein AidB-like acyl-CoA dehydrogenase